MHRHVVFLLLATALPLAPLSVMSTPLCPAIWKTNETARLRLHRERLALLNSRYRGYDGISSYRLIEEDAIRRIARGLSSPGAYRPPAPGCHLEAYFSEPDSSPQPFWTYVPSKPSGKPGLLLYLHGYNPDLDLLTAPAYPEVFTNLAETAGAYVAAPFGHGNTDFQHLGEADVLRVIDEMVARHGVDRDRVVLAGTSMGGLGAWCIAARWPALFNAVIIDSGRADFYVWHRLEPEDLPAWQREIVDSLFAERYLPALVGTHIIAGHGYFDEIVSYDQGAYPVNRLRELGSRRVRLHSYRKGHGVLGELFAEDDVRRLVLYALGNDLPHGRPTSLHPTVPGRTGFRLMDSLLSPFTFVAGGTEGGEGYPERSFRERMAEWERFSHGEPDGVAEPDLDASRKSTRHLFIFGEPESSPLIRTCLRQAGATYTPTAFVLNGRAMARGEGHGFLLATPSPFNPRLTAVIQCGCPWAAGGADNHRYDRIPDLASYRDRNDAFGYPILDTAAFLTPSGGYRFVGTEPKRADGPILPFDALPF